MHLYETFQLLSIWEEKANKAIIVLRRHSKWFCVIFYIAILPLGEIGSCLTLQSEKLQVTLKAGVELREAKRSFQVTDIIIMIRENSMIKNYLKA